MSRTVKLEIFCILNPKVEVARIRRGVLTVPLPMLPLLYLVGGLSIHFAGPATATGIWDGFFGTFPANTQWSRRALSEAAHTPGASTFLG